MAKIKFNFISGYDESGNEIVKRGTVETERYGERGVRFHHEYDGLTASSRTNEEGNGSWLIRDDGSEFQTAGTMQFSAGKDLTRSAVAWARDFMSPIAKDLGNLNFEKLND